MWYVQSHGSRSYYALPSQSDFLMGSAPSRAFVLSSLRYIIAFCIVIDSLAWLLLSGTQVRLSACQVMECQLSHVLRGARVTCCGQYRPLVTSCHGPSQSRCSLGAGVLGQTLCILQPKLLYALGWVLEDWMHVPKCVKAIELLCNLKEVGDRSPWSPRLSSLSRVTMIPGRTHMCLMLSYKRSLWGDAAVCLCPP